MVTLIIHQEILTTEQHSLIETQFSTQAYPKSQHWRVEITEAPSFEQLTQLRAQFAWDINLLPNRFLPEETRLVLSDMDSTLINIECIDEIAGHLGIKEQIASITEAAMRGELDFAQSLTARVQKLNGTPLSALETVYHEKLSLNPGAETLIQGLKTRDIRFALVSGGFTFFTDRLQQRLGLDFTRANVLAFDNNQQMTGEVIGDIIGAEAKRSFLFELCEQLNIKPHQVIAVGDGANDLLMMQEAGLSVAYHAKPTVQAQANTVLNHRGLDAMLDFIA
jgi:phosphoserine phosphatase